MNKRTICLYFQIHQPLSLRRYHFFDIGKNSDYYDNFANSNDINKLAERCYLPANNMLLNLIEQYGTKFKVSFSITGLVLEQFKEFAPHVIDSFKKLAQTGCVEFIAETYSHSLACLVNEVEFTNQIKRQSALIEELFGVKPVTFRNTEQIYSDEIGEMVAKMGYTTMLTEGARHVMGWKSLNYVYANSINPKLKLLLGNSSLINDITTRFSDREWDQWPLTADKYVSWLNKTDGEIVNLFMNYETLGEYQGADTGIFEFFSALPDNVFKSTDFEFLTPCEATAKHNSVASLHVPYPISWADEERDLTAWVGNDLQNSAFEELYKISESVYALGDKDILRDFDRIQSSDYFYFLNTKLFSNKHSAQRNSPYDTPYEAFINYMNVLSDIILRVERAIEKRKNIN